MSQFANLDKADWILINTFYKLECEVGDFVPHNYIGLDKPIHVGLPALFKEF